MEKAILDKIKKKFLEFRNYRSARLGDPWELTQDEWVEIFGASNERADIILRPRGVTRLFRQDEALPWSVDNLGIADQQIRKNSRNIAAERDADETLTKAFDRFAVNDISTPSRTLTSKQWIAELRDLEQSH